MGDIFYMYFGVISNRLLSLWVRWR